MLGVKGERRMYNHYIHAIVFHHRYYIIEFCILLFPTRVPIVCPMTYCAVSAFARPFFSATHVSLMQEPSTSINASTLTSQWSSPTIKFHFETDLENAQVAPWTYNCLATSAFLTAFRAPRTSKGDTSMRTPHQHSSECDVLVTP